MRRLISGSSTTAVDQTLTQLRVAYGTQPVLDEQHVIVGMTVYGVEDRPAQVACGGGGVATAFQRCGDLSTAKLELPVEQSQEQFVLGIEVRVDRALGESRGLTDRIDGGTGEPFCGEHFRGRIENSVADFDASGASPWRLDRRHGQKHTRRYRLDTGKYRKGWTTMADFALVIRGGTVFDGTGAAPRTADVGIRDRKVAAIAPGLPDGARTVDARGRWVMPGLIDVHTHYDAEVLLSPGLGESTRHGTTSIVLGNCSLSTVYSDADDCADMFARVEALPWQIVHDAIKEAKPGVAQPNTSRRWTRCRSG